MNLISRAVISISKHFRNYRKFFPLEPNLCFSLAAHSIPASPLSFQPFPAGIIPSKRDKRTFAMEADNSWRGVPISEIIGSQSPWGAPEFPLVTPSADHTVLYHIPSEGLPDDRPPKARIGEDKWDSEHVRMPCSSKSLYPVENDRGETHLRKRWEMISEALTRPILSSQDLAEAIISYNTKFKTVWKFTALHALFNDHLDEEESRQFFMVTLPQVAQLALDLPKLVQAPVPLLKEEKNRSISLTQLQAASLLANAFFCTFPRRNTMKRASEYASYPYINFTSLYEMPGHDDVIEKLKCICHYFRRVTTQAPVGVLTFSRRAVPASGCPRWARSARPLASLPVHVEADGTIEEAEGLVQVDFANKYLGGGVLGHGCVQEEIRFVICPELMVSMLFTEVLRPREALLIIGSERYSAYGGYSRAFVWRGDHRDATPFDSSLRRRTAVLAIDALPFARTAHQYRPQCLIRELNKAWVGMSFYGAEECGLNYPGVATGNWGCGAFGGCPQLKSLIQMMACAEARRPMAYYTFRDLQIRDEVANMYNLLVRHHVTVGQLYGHLMRFAETDVRRSHLHAYLHQALLDRANKPQQGPVTRMDIQSQLEAKEVAIEEELDPIQRELMNSPDLFSQDECSQKEPDTPNNTHTGETKHVPESNNRNASSDINSTTDKQRKDRHHNWDWNRRKSIDKPEKGDRNSHRQNDSYVQRKSQNKMAEAPSNHTSRLFEEMQKFDEDNGKLNLNVSVTNPLLSFRNSNEFNRSSNKSPNKEDLVEQEMAPNEDKMASNEIEMAAVEKQMAAEEETLNEGVVASTSNLKCTQKSRDLFASDSSSGKSLSESQNQNESQNQQDTDNKMDVSLEDKKKISRKITDYFTKKSL